MTRAMTTVVSKVQTSVITTSRPMKIKLRPTILTLREAGVGAGIVNVVKMVSELDRAAKILTDSIGSKVFNLAGDAVVRCISPETFYEASHWFMASTR